MIRILVLLAAVLVSVVSYYLLKKSEVFLPLLKEDPEAENQEFLTQFGKIYLAVALIGLIVALLNRPLFSFAYIFILLALSGTFSLLFSKKIQ